MRIYQSNSVYKISAQLAEDIYFKIEFKDFTRTNTYIRFKSKIQFRVFRYFYIVTVTS